MQRQSYKAKKLSNDHFKQLNDLGFCWGIRQQHASELKSKSGNEKWDFHHGTSKGGMSSAKKEHNVAMNDSATKQPLKDESKGDDEQLFPVTSNQGWEARFQQLVEYKNKNGDCHVPAVYKSNKGLGTWVRSQRRSNY